MKTLLALMISINLSGCMFQKVDSSDILWGSNFCKGVNNIVYIEATSVGSERVFCLDGTTKTKE